jgi:hypothetical protein
MAEEAEVEVQVALHLIPGHLAVAARPECTCHGQLPIRPCTPAALLATGAIADEQVNNISVTSRKSSCCCSVPSMALHTLRRRLSACGMHTCTCARIEMCTSVCADKPNLQGKRLFGVCSAGQNKVTGRAGLWPTCCRGGRGPKRTAARPGRARWRCCGSPRCRCRASGPPPSARLQESIDEAD